MIELSWYNTLVKPSFTPPAWIFAPAWTIIYIMIFISLILYIFKKTELDKKRGYILFFSQLVLNILWSPVFFGLHNIVVAMVIIVLLDILVLFNIKEFLKVSRASGLLLIPYFLWLIFATYLNGGFCILN